MRSIWIVLSLLSWGLPALSGHARAQDSVEVQAKALFDQGVAASDAERWADAASLFEQSVALRERPSTVFNLIGALYRVGRYEEGLRFAQRFLEITDPVGDAARRQEVEELRATIEEARTTAVPPSASTESPLPRVTESETGPVASLATTRHSSPSAPIAPVDAPTSNRRLRRALWVTGSLVVVGALTATLLLTLREGESSAPACGTDTTAGRCIAF